MRCALALFALVGCSSHYIPRSQGRVAVSMIDGKPVYIRDGQIYEHGFLGGGLVEAVAPNPTALAAAYEYHDHMRDGLLELLLGTAAMCGGMTYLAVDAAQSPDQNRPHINSGALIIGLAGMAVMLYGAGELAAAEPYRWDAINIFNDGAQLDTHIGPPGSIAALGAQATPTLKMRND
jgi:hypothetical protein